MLKHLPKGPRARDESEEAAGPTLGGAFKDYGGQRGACLRGVRYVGLVLDAVGSQHFKGLQVDSAITTIEIGATTIAAASAGGGAASAIATAMTAVRRLSTAHRALTRQTAGAVAQSLCRQNAAPAADTVIERAGVGASMTGEPCRGNKHEPALDPALLVERRSC